MSLLRRMTAFGVRLISGTDAGIARIKAHGKYADAVIELGQVTGTVPALVAASSSAAAAIGLGRSKGRLRRGYDADVLSRRRRPDRRPHYPEACTAGRAPRRAGLAPTGAVRKRLTAVLTPAHRHRCPQEPVTA